MGSRAQPLENRAGLLVRCHRLRRSALLTLQEADIVVASGQFVLKLGDRRVLARQPLPDRAGLLVRRQRLRRPARIALQIADVVVAIGQSGLELGDRRVLARQPLLDRAGLLVRRQRLRRSARLTLQNADIVVATRPGRLWNSVTDGLSRASRSKIARACSYDARASAGRPVSLCSDADVVVAGGQVALEPGDRRVLSCAAVQESRGRARMKPAPPPADPSRFCTRPML